MFNRYIFAFVRRKHTYPTLFDPFVLPLAYSCQIHHLNPVMLRAGGFGVITVCRPLEKERLLKELSPSFRNIAILVEDATILSAELEKTSSSMVRIQRPRVRHQKNAFQC